MNKTGDNNASPIDRLSGSYLPEFIRNKLPNSIARKFDKIKGFKFYIARDTQGNDYLQVASRLDRIKNFLLSAITFGYIKKPQYIDTYTVLKSLKNDSLNSDEAKLKSLILASGSTIDGIAKQVLLHKFMKSVGPEIGPMHLKQYSSGYTNDSLKRLLGIYAENFKGHKTLGVLANQAEGLLAKIDEYVKINQALAKSLKRAYVDETLCPEALTFMQNVHDLGLDKDYVDQRKVTNKLINKLFMYNLSLKNTEKKVLKKELWPAFDSFVKQTLTDVKTGFMLRLDLSKTIHNEIDKNMFCFIHPESGEYLKKQSEEYLPKVMIEKAKESYVKSFINQYKNQTETLEGAIVAHIKGIEPPLNNVQKFDLLLKFGANENGEINRKKTASYITKQLTNELYNRLEYKNVSEENIARFVGKRVQNIVGANTLFIKIAGPKNNFVKSIEYSSLFDIEQHEEAYLAPTYKKYQQKVDALFNTRMASLNVNAKNLRPQSILECKELIAKDIEKDRTATEISTETARVMLTILFDIDQR